MGNVIWIVYVGIVAAVCVIVLAVVAIGMRGRGRDRVPAETTTFLEKAAEHLNGEAPPPEKLVEAFEKIPVPHHDKHPGPNPQAAK
ncbi:MAG: hypothetical protein LBR21_11505 [Propionibacteriaceae bacterium]|jgi:hypothetical protein|nr:hypothetical protein [Propionibacteriaceae bacterium]